MKKKRIYHETNNTINENEKNEYKFDKQSKIIIDRL